MNVVTFGRSSQCQVVFNDPSVSSVHCQIVQHDNGLYSIVDFNSLNGTYVNGRRVYGEMPMNPGDSVRIGNIGINWQSYFGGTSSRKKSTHTVVGIVLDVIIIVAFIVGVCAAGLSLFKKHSLQTEPPIETPQEQMPSAQNLVPEKKQTTTDSLKKHQIAIGDVGLDFGMSIDDIRRSNSNATVSGKKRTPGIEGEDIGFSIASRSYYMINNNIVAILDKNNRVGNVLTWSPLFYTSRRCHVGSTWGEVLKKYPNVKLYLEYNLYDYKHQDYDDFYCLFDEHSGPIFYFHRSQFTQEQLSAIDELGGADFEIELDMNALPADVFESICSTVKVLQIEAFE